jgi:hypothetical protein
MPLHPKSYKTKATPDSDFATGNSSTACQGWNIATCIGAFPETSDSCRPCEPDQEMWISLEFGENKGICVCLIEPVKQVKAHMEGLVIIGLCVALLAYIFKPRIFRRGR